MPKIATNFQVGSAQPIDSRFVVENESDLSGLKAYEGLEVYIKQTKTKKMYNGNEWIDSDFSIKKYIDETLGEIETLLEAI
jgi:hypothetical protein